MEEDHIEESVQAGAGDEDVPSEHGFPQNFEKIVQPEYDKLIKKLCDLIGPDERIDIVKFREENKQALTIFVEKTLIRVGTRPSINRKDVWCCFLDGDGRGDKDQVRELIDLLSPLLIPQPEFDAAVKELCELIDSAGEPLDFKQFKTQNPLAGDIFISQSDLDLEDQYAVKIVREAYLDYKGYGDVEKTRDTIQDMKKAMEFDKQFKLLCKLIDEDGKDPLDTKEFQQYVASCGLLETELKVEAVPNKLKHEKLRAPFIEEIETGDMDKLKAFIDDLSQSIQADKEDLAEEKRRREMERQKELETKFLAEFEGLLSVIPNEVGDLYSIKKFKLKHEKAADALLELCKNLPQPMASKGEIKRAFGVDSDTILTEKQVEDMRDIKEKILALIK